VTLIELIGLPIALAIAFFLVLLPFLGAKAAWDAAGTLALVISFIWFGGLWVRKAVRDRLPKCRCGKGEIQTVSISEQGQALECAACGERYQCSNVDADGWRRCRRLDAALAPQSWKKRRGWGAWTDDDTPE
jgi:hypothetical protein